MFGNQEENATATNQDVEMNDADDEDRARSEVRFSFKVENIHNLKDTALSPPHYARNLPWKIMVMPTTRYLGFFLQCNGETESSAWSCYASAELILVPQKPGVEPFSRRIQHLFFIKENDWGFSHFMTFSDLLDPDKGFIKDDSIILEVCVQADAPHGVSWDSKKHTGYVGLKNQGATCYMNSLLQTLYFTNQLRKAVYKMPTESDDSNKSVALALQRVFHELQFSDKPVGTKKLTKSFGWETLDSFMQHDVQEFLRVLLDKLEIKMKGTCVEGTVPKLFEGKMISFIKCKKVNYTSSRAETFYDIQLNVKGKKDILESFKDYIEPEVLEGDNKYDAGVHGLQDAEKGVTFENLPPVLHLHLMRFQYDPVTDCSVKFNDRFEFYDRIELDDFLKEKGPTPATYILHAVLVHSGDNHGGHYVVYINPKGDNKWCKFDDDVVSKCSKDEAVAHNFGGNDEDSGLTVKHSTNAYMLVYIRESELANVLEDVTERDIPQEVTTIIVVQFSSCIEDKIPYLGCNDEDSGLTVKHSTNAYMLVYIRESELANVLEDVTERDIPQESFDHHSHCCLTPSVLFVSRDLFNRVEVTFCDKTILNDQGFTLELSLKMTYEQLVALVAQHLNTDKKLIQMFKRERLGTLKMTYEQLVALVAQHLNTDKKLIQMFKVQAYKDTPGNPLPHNFEGTLKDILAPINKPKMPKKMHYQKLSIPVVELINKRPFKVNNSTNDPSRIYSILIHIPKVQAYKDTPGNPLPHNFEGTLKDILAPINKPKMPKKMHYQKLSIPVVELINKRPFKVRTQFLDEAKKDAAIQPELLGPDNGGSGLLRLLEISNQKITAELDHSVSMDQLFGMNATTKIYRLEEIPQDEVSLDPDELLIPVAHFQKDIHNIFGYPFLLRIKDNERFSKVKERLAKKLNIQEKEFEKSSHFLDPDELLIPVAHFQKDIHNIFGYPFLLRIKDNERFSKVKERLAKKLNIQEKEFEKYKFGVINNNRITYIEEDSDCPVSINQFRSNISHQDYKVWLGLDHINKAPKRSRLNYLEKAIKIYN
ncbi:ubiquitin carboxyl-terminal hydrolase 7-like [Diaphorina citri]|uniref:Ubiquitin carboxyl-terminal hydrolase 7 n=1 Tax=Diaphorina citri TaxID=121845 RepID=A0A3Q0IST7_DIACI|nr:ubiquitin carboxyl-terminal hydrolase 7-like [Diaphorina citri]